MLVAISPTDTRLSIENEISRLTNFSLELGRSTFSFTNEKYVRIDNWLISLNPFDRNEREECKKQITITRLMGGGHASVNEIRRDVTRNVHTERAFCPQNFEPLYRPDILLRDFCIRTRRGTIGRETSFPEFQPK